MTDVEVLRWPDDAVRRWALANAHVPRLLVIDADVSAPLRVDDLEDVLCSSADAVEVAERLEALRRRAHLRSRPTLDDHGLLRHDGRWVAIPDPQVPVVRLLVSRFTMLVPLDEVTRAYADTGRSATARSVSSLVVRMKSKVAAVGLELSTLRRRGLVLDRPRSSSPV